MKAFAVFLISVCAGIAADAQSIVWETVHPRPGLPTLRSVSFGEGIFVAAGDGGVYFSDDDGRTWRPGTNSLPGNYTSVTFANGLFVAVGNTNTILVSDDGKSWESHTISANGLLAVIHANGQFVAAGQGGLIATSADGRTWTVRSTPTTMSLSMLAFGNATFVATDGVTSGFGTGQVRFLTSTDGAEWSEVAVTLPFVNPGCIPGISCTAFGGLAGLVFAEGQFAAIGHFPNALAPTRYDTKALTSANGTNWTVQTASAAGSASFYVYHSENSLYRANERSFHLTTDFMATNLNEWSPIPLPYSQFELLGGPAPLRSVAYGNSTYVFVGGVDGWAWIARGTNLSNLDRLDSQALSIPRGLAARGPTIVTVDPTTTPPQSLSVSTNGGFFFNFVTLPNGSGALSSVHSGQEKFVAVGKGGTILRSSDGVSWSKRLSNTSSDLNGIVFDNSQWVGVGQNGVIVTSPDASFFALRSSGTEVALRAVVFGGGLFIAVGDSGVILRSQDGQNWTIFGTEEALDLYGVAYGSGRFVATGTNGIVHTSTNGISWSSARVSGANGLSDVAFRDGVFLAIDGSPTAHISTNGLDWAPIRFPKPVYGTDSSDGELWAVGGDALLRSFMYIAKAHSQAPPALFALRAAINAAGQFTLSFVPPSPGDYSILSAARITDSWQLTALLTNVSSLTTWTNLTPTEPARFYVVRKN